MYKTSLDPWQRSLSVKILSTAPLLWLLLEIALLAGFLLLAYSNHFENSFHFDDSHTIVDNGAIRDLRNLPRFFTDASTFSALPSNQSYRPIVSASFAIDYALARGLHPFWFQLSSFTFFLAVVLLLAVVIKNLLDARAQHPLNAHIAIAAAGLYALHPANADTVNYIIARSDVLSTLGVLASFAWAQRRPGGRADLLAALPACFGVLAKPTAATFAPLYAVYSWMFPVPAVVHTHGARRQVIRIGFAFILCGAAVAFVSHMTPKQWVAGANNSTAYLLTQPYVALLYFKTFLWPTGLSADYDLQPFATLADFRFWAGLGFIFGLAGCALYCAARPRLRVIGFGLVWFIFALLPTSLFPMAEVMNDHRAFFPYAGLVMALAGMLQLAVARERRRSRPVAMILGFVALACYPAASLATFQRNKVWNDEETLWHDATIKSPHNGRGLMNYGNTLMEKGDFTSALDYFHRAQILIPNYPPLVINIAIAESFTGKPADAERDFRRALALAPEVPSSYMYYARWLTGQGRSAEAVALLRRALSISPGDLTAQSFLASALELEIKAAPVGASADSWVNLSQRRYQEKDYSGAIAAAEKAIEVRPDCAEAWNNMGAAYNSLGHFATAEAVLEEAVRLKPDLALARNNLDYAQRMLKVPPVIAP